MNGLKPISTVPGKEVGEEMALKYEVEGKNMGFDAAIKYALDYDKD